MQFSRKNTLFAVGFLGFSILLVQVLAGGASRTVDELHQIRQAIEERGARWTAVENEISAMNPGLRRGLLGLVPEDDVFPSVGGQADVLEGDPEAVFPPELDWRNVDGHNWVTWIRNQWDCGACVAFGSIGALESRMNIFLDEWTWDPDLSEGHLFFCGGGSCWWGWMVSSSMNYLKNSGVPEEACFPYVTYDAPCSDGCDDWRDHKIEIRDWDWVSNNQNAIKTYLQDGPLTTCMNVYTDFFYYGSGVYEHSWGSYEGGHCITFVGWDDDENCWICKNSWGAGWGETGYFRIAYGNSGIGSSTTHMELFPLIRVEADKGSYAPGEDHVLGVRVVNPGSGYTAKVKIWILFPNGTKHTVYSGVHNIPGGVVFEKADFMTFTVPSQAAPGEYAWYGVIQNGAGTDTKSFDICTFDIIE